MVDTKLKPTPTRPFRSPLQADEPRQEPGNLPQAQSPSEDQPRGPQIIIDERDLEMVYTNAYRIHAADDVVIDFGYNMPNPNPTQQGVAQVLYKGTHRVIMNYANAKRLAGSLGQLIRQFEQRFGEIKLPMPPQGGQAN